MNGQEHFVTFDRIRKCLISICNPYQLLLTVPSADISAQIYQGGIHLIIHGVRFSQIRGAFDGNGSLVIISGL